MWTVYRLGHSSTGTALPLHWSYLEPFTIDNGEWEDNRWPGFQVWTDLSRVLLVAATGKDADGSYPVEEYPTLLVVTATDVYDGAGEWLAVRPEDVVRVRVLQLDTFLASLAAVVHAGYDVGEDHDGQWTYDEALEDFLGENQAWVAAEVARTLIEVPIQFVETLWTSPHG